MVTPRALGVLLLRLLLPLASGKVTEQPRNVCLGLPKMNTYDHFGLNDTAKCFTECGQQGSKPCKLETLQRYWLNYEIHLVEESVTDTVNMSFLKSFVKDISTNISEDLHFSLTPFQIPTQMTDDGHEHPDRVRLPRTLFKSLQGSRSMVRLAITVLNVGPGNLFKGPQLSLEDGSRVLDNRVVGLSLGHTCVTGLADPLEITFSHQQQPPNVTLSCVFWDANKGSTGDWSSKGCSTELRAKETVCRCDHLTFFALLLRPVLDNVTVQALKYISQAGCGASMFFLAFTIALYAALRFYWQRLKSEDAPKIHVALSISLFLLNLVFFINMGVGRRASEAACRAHGAVFHYFLLCTFTWMGLEAFHLYLLIIRVFNTYFGHYFLKLSLVGWGLPALIVFGNGIAKSYGLYAIHDKENTTTLELVTTLIQLFYNIMWGKQNMFWGPNWTFCTRWCKETAEWSLVTALSPGVGGRRVETGEGLFSVTEGAGSMRKLPSTSLSTATSSSPSSSAPWSWAWWPGRSSLCRMPQWARCRG
nr:adhesion G protein-coupled receptor G3 isoform X3 [Equus caballus]